MARQDDLSRSLVTLQQDSTLIAVVELSQSSWLVAGIVPGLARHPLKKLEPDQEALLRLLRRWQEEATEAGRTVARVAVAFEAGRDGFWLARWLRARGVEAHVIHPTSVAVSREHRRAKTDRLDTELLKRAGRRRSRQCLEPSAGCGASRATAAWPPSRPSRRRTPGAPTASGRAWWASAPGS
jgi:transposase